MGWSTSGIWDLVSLETQTKNPIREKSTRTYTKQIGKLAKAVSGQIYNDNGTYYACKGTCKNLIGLWVAVRDLERYNSKFPNSPILKFDSQEGAERWIGSAAISIVGVGEDVYLR